MPTIDRWRKWRPASKKSWGTPGTVPSKPPEATFEGFDGTHPGAPEKFLEKLWQPFVRWFDSRIWLDAESVALRRPSPRWSTSVSGLYADFCAWMFAHRRDDPPTGEQFRQLLEKLCCEIRLIHGEEFVSNVALKEDVEAHRHFEKVN